MKENQTGPGVYQVENRPQLYKRSKRRATPRRRSGFYSRDGPPWPVKFWLLHALPCLALVILTPMGSRIAQELLQRRKELVNRPSGSPQLLALLPVI